jgi:hypothetical protein
MPSPSPSPDHDDKVSLELVIANEFAGVLVRRDDSAAGPRLEVRIARSGQRIFLDALELERIAAMQHWQLTPIVAPGAELNTEPPA